MDSNDLFIVRTMYDEPGKCVASSRRGLDAADCPERSTRVVMFGDVPVFALCEAHAQRLAQERTRYTLGPTFPPFDIYVPLPLSSHPTPFLRELSGRTAIGEVRQSVRTAGDSVRIPSKRI